MVLLRLFLGWEVGVLLAGYGASAISRSFFSSTYPEIGLYELETAAGNTMSMALRVLVNYAFWVPVVILSLMIMFRKRPMNRIDYWGMLLVFLGSVSVTIILTLILIDDQVLKWPFLWTVTLVFCLGVVLLLAGRLKYDFRRIEKGDEQHP